MLKRFDFFSRSLVTYDGIALDHRSLNPTQAGHEAFQQDDFTCVTAGGGRLALGDARGGVLLMGAIGLKPRRFELLTEPIMALALVGEYLITVSATSQVAVFKVPSGTGTGPDTDERPAPVAGQIQAITNAWRARNTAPTLVTCLAVAKDLKSIAIGYRDGYVLRLTSKKPFRDEHPTDDTFMWLTTTPSAGACSAIGYTPDGISVWVAFERKLSVFNEASTETRLDVDEGCKLDCAVVGPDPNVFVVGKKDRIAFYTVETPGSCYSILGEREKLTRCKDNIVVVSSGEIWKGVGSAMPKASNRSRGGDLSGASKSESQKQTVQIFDLANKFVAHEFQLWRDGNDACAFMAADDDTGCVFILTKSRKRLWRIQEKPIETKLDNLLKRNLFPIAAALGKQSGCEPGFVSDIYRRYGDHLYDKGNFDDAVAQFVLTIGRLEPSYVIRKFLDAPRVKNLTTYLEALHRYGATSLSNPESSLLTSPGSGGISDFHQHRFLPGNQAQPIPSADHTTLLLTCYAKLKEEDKIVHLLESKDVKIDVDAALAVLKDTGRINPALRLAKDRDREDWYVRTLLELADDTSLEYAKRALEFIQSKDRVTVFKSHGSRLMTLLPSESLRCIREWIDTGVATVETVLECLADFPKELEALCKDAISKDDPDVSPAVWNTCLELVLTHGDTDAAYDILTHSRANYDGNSALTTVRRFGFRKGELYLHERSQRWDLLLQSRIEQGDDEEQLLVLAKTRLPLDADAWMNVLRYLSQKPPSSPQRDLAIKDALDYIGQHNVLPPLLALRILSEQRKDTSASNGLNLGVVRRYLLGQIQRAAKQTEDDERELKELREDTERMRREARTLSSEPKVFNATTCCMTGAPLELPVVHFMSGNSYNLSSLPTPSSSTGDRYEDPKCVQDQNSVMDIRRGLAKRRVDVDEEFFSELQAIKGGEEGFNLVAEYFGKCLFDDDDEDNQFLQRDEVE